MALTYSQFNFIPEEQQDKIIEIVYGGNIPSEIKRIKEDLKKNKDKSEFMETLLENITFKYGNKYFGYYYEVSGLIYVKPKNSPEEHDS